MHKLDSEPGVTVGAHAIAAVTLLVLSGSVLCGQVLTSAVVYEAPAQPPMASAETPKGSTDTPSQTVRTHDFAPLPPITTPLDRHPLRAPNHAIEKLALRYDVSKIGDRRIASGMNFFSLERETSLGLSLSEQVEESARLLKDPVINEYVNRIGQNLVRNSDARVPFTIKLIDDDDVNAFALPGGFFYINTGLLLEAESEAELAGVMSHEIAHVAARHATRNESKAELFNLASIPLSMIGGPAAMALRNVASIAVPMGFMKFSRDAEREADLLGIEYAYKAGYDPRAMIDLFERLDAQEKTSKKPGKMARAFATHPMTAERMQRAQQEIAYILPPREEYIESTSEFEQIKARLQMLQRMSRVHAQPNQPILRVKDQNSRGAINTAPVKTSRSNTGPILRRRDLEQK